MTNTKQTEPKDNIKYLCEYCKGTGAESYLKEGGYIACRMCNGNGLDPLKFFKFSGPGND